MYLTKYCIDVDICYKDYPASINVTSTGPAAEKYPYLMGRYVLEVNKTAQLRPVYKKTDRDYYIYYSRKLYFILVITGSVMFIIAAAGWWIVSDVITDNSGWIKTEKAGLLTIPTSGWQYVDGGKFVGGDDTLKFI